MYACVGTCVRACVCVFAETARQLFTHTHVITFYCAESSDARPAPRRSVREPCRAFVGPTLSITDGDDFKSARKGTPKIPIRTNTPKYRHKH